MVLGQGQIYHLYNKGNNRERIFFQKENYYYFLKKIAQHISPFADVLAWCLMPNHFHMIIAVQNLETSYRVNACQQLTTIDEFSANMYSKPPSQNKLINSIATMLRSYTRAINIQQKRTGSLFREGTKAVWLGSIEGEKLKYQNRSKIGGFDLNLNENYLQTCFQYIHNNPVKARLAKETTDWGFSSALDIKGIRKESIINKDLINELGLRLE